MNAITTYVSSFRSFHGHGWCATVWGRNSDGTQSCLAHVKGYESKQAAEQAAKEKAS